MDFSSAVYGKLKQKQNQMICNCEFKSVQLKLYIIYRL